MTSLTFTNMVEFNADGSLKLTGKAKEITDNKEYKMKHGRCITIKKNLVSFTAPKKCMLDIKISNMLNDVRFIKTILNQHKEFAKTPMKLVVEDFDMGVEIGTDFLRCRECSQLISKYREFLGGNIIVESGNCTYETHKRGFSEEDYFD